MLWQGRGTRCYVQSQRDPHLTIFHGCYTEYITRGDEDDLDFVTSIKIRNIVFEIAPDSDDPGVDLFADGNPDTFDFVSSLSISLSATIDGVNTVVPIANLPISDPQIASNTQTLNLNVEDRDIRDFIEAPGGSELLVSFEGLTPVDFVRISANIRYRVGIGIR